MSMTCENSGSQNNRRRRWFLRVAAALLVAAAVAVLATLRLSTRERAGHGPDETRLSAVKQALLEHLAESPDDTDARYRLAVLLRQSDMESALEHFRQIPPDAAEYLAARRHVAHICLLMKREGELTLRDEEAELALKTLERADPSDFGVKLSLAELYFRRREQKKALHYARQGAEMRPGRTQTHLLVADILDELGRTAEMIAPLRQVIELEPDCYGARINLAYALLFAGRLDEAQRESLWCLKRNEQDVAARQYLAAIAREHGQPEDALQQIRKALEIAPGDFRCRMLEAKLLLPLGESQKAYGNLKPFYNEHRNDRDYLETLAQAAAESGHLDEARKHRQRISYLIQVEAEERSGK